MSTPMEIDCDPAEMQPIDLSVRKSSVSPSDERKTPEEDGPPPQAQDSRPTVVVMQPAAGSSSEVRKPQAVVSPQIAKVARKPDGGQRSTADSSSSSSHRPSSSSRRPSSSSSSHRPPPPPLRPLYSDERDLPFGPGMTTQLQQAPAVQQSGRQTSRLDRDLQQHQLDLLAQQKHLYFQQQLQNLRFQHELNQHQLRVAAFGNDDVHGALHLGNIMLARQITAGALSVPMPPSPASSTGSNPFPFGHALERQQTSVNDFGGFNNNTRPYVTGLQSGSRGHLDGQLSPESTASEDNYRFGGSGVFDAAALIINASGNGGGGAPDVDAEDVADIYRSAEYQAFRQRYMDNLGPPRNYEKMRRSVPAGKQPPAFDVTYAQKRMKNNEAAKKSRDAKRQKFLENQISVMYLTKKIREMNELKRRLLMSMS